ncbi:hypothetical protein CGLO_06523 [Colletotrichum gloeosporioides Cg-14]|uniref:Uncharacterized protein n=1 Tax=Colletotrichum gloeosporioides (strain Cg-14) TaxID=1237896 RepID=T0KE53_COLGC|nr:hypothetical protein CGLO_06523 [Colletotrichum gloeosporioides Cg-14]
MPTERDSTQEPFAGAGKPDWTALPTPRRVNQSTSQDVVATRQAPRPHPTGSTRAGIATYHEDAIHANRLYGIQGNMFDFNNEVIQPLINLFAPRQKCMLRHNDARTVLEFIGPPDAVTYAQGRALSRATNGTNKDDTTAIHGLRIYCFQELTSSGRPQSIHPVMVSLFRIYSQDPNAENDFLRDPIDNHEWKEYVFYDRRF